MIVFCQNIWEIVKKQNSKISTVFKYFMEPEI